MGQIELKNLNFGTISLSDLEDANFNVPNYQRGYRWGKCEVEHLISDIMECDQNKKYCLQPLVVQEKDSVYNLIDGQQRLTTIKIISQLAKAENAKYVVNYSIAYEIRKGSEAFIEEIAIGEPDSSNPDFHYMSEAKSIITEYAEKKKKEVAEIYKKIKEHAQFIWYCIDKDLCAIEMFQKLNVGKIQLTDAELVKAVLLTRENYYTSDEMLAKGEERLAPEIAGRQAIKAHEWDRIEQSLANDDFWYFIADADKDKEFLRKEPRIEIILDAVAKDISPGGESKSTFNTIYDDVKGYQGAERVRRVEAIWDMISAKHALFSEWFYDDELFHLIGFLVRAGLKTVREISKDTKNKRKSQIIEWLRTEIKSWDYLYKKSGKTGAKIKKTVADITYDDKKSDLRSFFLLFNVLSILQTVSRDKNTKTVMRFPFEKYENQDWDIEHIHAKADEDLELTDEDENSIYNLTLLDRKTNQDYKNASFINKQDYIRQKVKTDRFVLICTQNVFFKVYTSSVKEKGFFKDKEQRYQSLLVKRAKIKRVEDYKAEIDKWNELDWLFYEWEIKTVVFDDFLG